MIGSATAPYEARAARAALLAVESDVAREPLEFAAMVLGAQAQLAGALEAMTFRGVFDDDAAQLVPLHQSLLQSVANAAPGTLASAGRDRLSDDAPTARTRLEVYWNGDGSAREDYLSRLLMQPYAELLRIRSIRPDRVHKRGHCPFCGGKPWISVRKSASDESGGARYLHCSLCGLEWNVNRLCCPSCFEEDPHKLPVFRTDAHPLVRIESCETCSRYLKSIDLTQDARPIPPIDDLLSLSMDLWALDQGLTRLEPGIAGI